MESNLLTTKSRSKYGEVIVKNHETRAWQAWKTTYYTVLVIALFITVAHVIVGV
jgi:hypothetical protein